MSQEETKTGKYIYCVISCNEPRKFATLGIGERGDEVYTLPHLDLAAVISDSPLASYESSRRNMMAHTLVLEEVMREFTILPVRFGTVAPTAEAISEKLLKRRHDELSALMNEIEGRVELGLKAFWYEESLFQEIVDENPSIRDFRDSLANLSPQQSYYDRIRLGEMVEKKLREKREAEAESIMAHLSPIACRSKANSTISDRMILNAAFLVDKSREPEFDREVNRLDEEKGHLEMFKYVGPAPPYNFVNLVVNWNE